MSFTTPSVNFSGACLSDHIVSVHLVCSYSQTDLLILDPVSVCVLLVAAFTGASELTDCCHCLSVNEVMTAVM